MNTPLDDLTSSIPSDIDRKKPTEKSTSAPKEKPSPKKDNEEALIKERRKKAGSTRNPDPSWGLALSGGGIRSATFCLGFLRSLAKNKILKDFDYLSTVSGGGYVGASLGRLYRSDRQGADVEKGVAEDNSIWLWWLRANGRYLTPAGAKDWGLACASILRGLLATHGELAMLILFLAGWVLLPHLLVTLYPPEYKSLEWSAGILTGLGSVWWWLMIFPMFALVHQVFAYWFCRDASTKFSWVGILVFAAACCYFAWRLFSMAEQKYQHALRPETADYLFITAGLMGCALLIAPVTAAIASFVDNRRRLTVSQRRSAHTKRLALCLWSLLIVAALGLLDCVSWQLARYLETTHPEVIYSSALTITGAFALGRTLLPQIQKLFSGARASHFNLKRIVNVVGLLMSLTLAVIWTTAFHAFMLPDSLVNPGSGPPPTHNQWEFWAVLMIVVSAFLFWTRKSFELLNMASLHNHYRSRIERAYVSSGNSETGTARFPQSPLDAVSRELTNKIAPLVDVIDGDDIELGDYCPHEYGGPIHLINCCINQSVDDRTGNYNADRKGIALTISALGVETGIQAPQPVDKSVRLGRLSKWIAISGAAASTGMGSMTSPGLASLLFMSGLRLGYWTPSLGDRSSISRGYAKQAKQWGRWFFMQLPKPLAIVSESVARFPGLQSPIWFLSDGGHFDNTGIYPLLKRKVSVIVAADCGADPKYLFGDLESLVRKADIDYGAKLEFMNAAALQGLPSELLQHIGTPETIGPEPSPKCLVVGRIRYCDGSIGTLLIVKPCRLDNMPFDIVAYADRNADFPQQTTGDQFFDEAQWESYHQLGLLIGENISREAITAAKRSVADAGSLNSSLTAAALASRKEPETTRRQRIGETVRASVGAGISLSLILAVWQGFEQFQIERNTEAKDVVQKVEAIRTRIKTDGPGTIHAFEMNELKRAAEKFAMSERYDALVTDLENACLEKNSDQNACGTVLAQSTAESRYDFYWFANAPRAPNEQVAAPDKQVATSVATAATTGSDAKATTVASASSVATPGQPLNSIETKVTTTASGSTTVMATPVASVPDIISRMPMANAATVPLPLPGGQKPVLRKSTISLGGESTSVACRSNAAKIHVFLQIYDEDSRLVAQQAALAIVAKLGLAKPPIENVVATAERQNAKPPHVWSIPVVIYHQDVGPACVSELRTIYPGTWLAWPLPSSLRGSSGVVEYWLPPQSTAGTLATAPSQARPVRLPK